MIFTYTNKGYESSYRGEYAKAVPNSGSLKKGIKDAYEFLNGERLTPPKLEQLNVHNNKHISISRQRINLAEYLPDGVDVVKLVFAKRRRGRFLRLYKPDAKPNSKPLVTLGLIDGVIQPVERMEPRRIHQPEPPAIETS